jgi:hypothetical protein
MSSDGNEDFEPLVVLQLSPATPEATKRWIINRLTASHDEDEGAALLARFEPNPENHVSSFAFSFAEDKFQIVLE